MTSQFKRENRLEASGMASREVVNSQTIESPLITFARKVKSSVKAENIEINENKNTITFYVNNVFVILEPQVEENGELIYTTITQIFYNNQLKALARIYISSTKIILEDSDRKLTAEFENVEEDPLICSKEEWLFDYLSDLGKIEELDEFIEHIESEFKDYAGLS